MTDAFRRILPGHQDITSPPPDQVFPSTLTLRDLHTLGDFVIQPTDNLLQHLLVQKHRNRKMRPTVYVFFNVSAISKLQTWNEPLNGVHFDDPKFLEETLQTLALLLPSYDEHTQSWFMKYCKKMQRNLPRNSLPAIDRRAGRLPFASRRKVGYYYWLPRLLDLEKEFANSSPRTLRQFLRDRRRYRELTLYWVAVIALVLTLISSLTGVVSAIVGGLALRGGKDGKGSLDSACCCRDVDSITNILTVASVITAPAPGMTLEPARIIDPSQTMIVTVRITTTITVAGA
ncbi:hypothetical protein CABS01_01112 [Colletotrichum abscissum]|uniref:uncharacterized protein n=1 Tax=Colletotrichum abscissum TaxID=1671311 RepID=UPI0027D50FBC|nr:uncharacterized protein CABS01_01112 [Colletotrichum abscissum]KAK1505644.1 hypothetical protein CABS01_01112 [Colletotrichum abscissum]